MQNISLNAQGDKMRSIFCDKSQVLRIENLMFYFIIVLFIKVPLFLTFDERFRQVCVV